MEAKQKEFLLSVARSAIKDFLTSRKVHHFKSDELEDKTLFERRACFVTLTIHGELRGCIGSLLPRQPLINDVVDNAINAAFRDPRFYPLTLAELNQANIEISVLSIPEKLDYQNKKDLLQKIRPNIDGVIIRKGFYEATFLPQVWSELRDKESFFENLCLKAGLDRNCIDSCDVTVETYQVEAFSENETAQP
ncbi:MAG: AmmeMemoRadiSam system protein A [Caldisericaceae bacterium]